MQELVRAIDVGSGNTKYVVGVDGKRVKCESFPSIAPTSRRTDLAEALGRRRKTVALEIGGLRYEVGPDATLPQEVFSARNMDDDFCASNEYLALARGALHYMKVENIDTLVVGLPVSTFQLKKGFLEKRLTGTHDVGCGRKVQVRKVKVLAQPHGALMNYALNERNYAAVKTERNLIIDPGARTFDWLVTQGLKIFDKRSHAVNRGMLDVLRVLAEGISRTEKTQFTDYDRLDIAVRLGSKPLVFQKEYDLGRHMIEARQIAKDAVTEMRRYVQDGSDIDNVILGGGGAFFFKNAIQEAFPRHRIHELKDGMFANVVGFQLAGQGMASAEQERGAVHNMEQPPT